MQSYLQLHLCVDKLPHVCTNRNLNYHHWVDWFQFPDHKSIHTEQAKTSINCPPSQLHTEPPIKPQSSNSPWYCRGCSHAHSAKPQIDDRNDNRQSLVPARVLPRVLLSWHLYNFPLFYYVAPKINDSPTSSQPPSRGPLESIIEGIGISFITFCREILLTGFAPNVGWINGKSLFSVQAIQSLRCGSRLFEVK